MEGYTCRPMIFTRGDWRAVKFGNNVSKSQTWKPQMRVRTEIWEWGNFFEFFVQWWMKFGPFSHSEAWFYKGQLLEPHSEWITVGRSGKTTDIFEKNLQEVNFLLTFLRRPFLMLVMWCNHVTLMVVDQGVNSLRRLSSAEQVVCTCILGGQLHMYAVSINDLAVSCLLGSSLPW